MCRAVAKCIRLEKDNSLVLTEVVKFILHYVCHR